MATTPSLPRTDATDATARPSPVAGASLTTPAQPAVKPMVGMPSADHGDTRRAGPAGSVRTMLARYPVPRGILLLGVLGATLAAVGGLGARNMLSRDPFLSDSSLSWLTYGHGKVLAHGLLYLGIGLITWAWIRLGRAARAGAVGAPAVLVTTAVWVLPLLVCPPLFSNDVYSYLAQGDLPLHGLNPYHTGVAELPSVFDDNVTPVWQHTAAPYGPFFILLAEGVVKLIGYHQIAAVVMMRWVIAIPGLALCAFALTRLARHYGGSARIALWLGLANPLTLIYLVGGPHNDLLMAGLLGAGAVLVLQRRPLLGFLLVSLAAAIKAPAALALPFLVWVWAAYLPGSPKARFAKACGGGVAVFVAAFAATTFAARVDLGWLPALTANNVVVNWMSLPTGLGQLVHLPVSIFANVDASPFITVTRDLGMLALVAVAVRQWWLARGGGPDAIRRAGIALFVAVLLSPTTFPWYFFWPLILCGGLAWSGTGLMVCSFLILWSMLSTYPSGDAALYNWPYLLLSTAFSVLAAISLVRVDPLRLSSKRRLEDFGVPPGTEAHQSVRA
ncbi:MAG: polyprenol phosphomannose-dependent alpha 1,6 mannosyltransferase MptB [Sciscionella sp.]